MKKKHKYFENFHSQLELPFLETDINFIKEIFQTLKLEFGLESNSKQKFIDLGAGNGTVVIYAALNYNIKSYGIEINQNLFTEAKNRIKALKNEKNSKAKLLKKLKIRLGDFYQFSLKNYEFIYIYSIPSMQRFLKHVFNTAKKGAIIISYKYPLKGLNSILKEKYRLSHENAKQEINTFFYKKISWNRQDYGEATYILVIIQQIIHSFITQKI